MRSTGRNTKKDRILTELRELIASGALPRGERISQDALAARFNTSITPVREAIMQLEAEGLLVSQAHRGVHVSDADLGQIRGIYIARRRLEPYVAQRAALNITRRDIASALEIADAMAETDATSSALSILNREFHFLFYARCGVPSLVELIDWLWRSYPWDILLVLSDRAANAADEHRAMARAVAGCDLAAIEETFTTNIVRSYLAIARHLGESDPCDPYPVEG